MEDFQQQIRQLLKTFDCEYLTLDCFLADDLQIYFSDNLNADFTIKERAKREITFDFTGTISDL